MKKNAMMRIASLVLVLTLLSTCAISGTFAKYVTSDTASDTARVAKFGVVLTASDSSSFKTEYDSNTNGYTGVTVKSSTTDKVVAPGTKDDGGIKFAISGTPEVATKITAAMTAGYTEIFLKAGTYTDYTKAKKADGSYETFTLENDYYPVVFTLKQTSGKVQVEGEWVDITADSAPTIKSGKLSEIAEALNTYTASATYAPNVDLGAEFTLTWEWVFGDSANNQADTVLGQIAAGTYTGLTDGTDYELDIDYTVTFTVEQID